MKGERRRKNDVGAGNMYGEGDWEKENRVGERKKERREEGISREGKGKSSQ